MLQPYLCTWAAVLAFALSQNIAIIEAPDPVSAALVLMESCEVYRVSLAAVRLPDGSLRPWFGVLCPTGQEVA
jgi:hypothetical protein